MAMTRVCLKSAVAGAGAALAGLAAFGATSVDAHCQVPCGIYDDDGRVKTLREDATTIRKAQVQVLDLAEGAPTGRTNAQSVNQMTRWVNTKEQHASHIIQTVSEYFLTQKVKPVAKDDPHYAQYCDVLAQHHSVMVAAMKAKQSVDTKTSDDLDHALDHLASVYSKGK